MAKDWRGADVTYSFMQVLSPTSIRIRNILLPAKDGTESFYKEDLAIKNGNFTAIAGTLRLEGTNQRAYVIERVANEAISVTDFGNHDWEGIKPAFLDNRRNPSIVDPSLDMKGIYLAIDDQFLYVMITLFGLPPASGLSNYFFEARSLPDVESFSFCTIAQPTLSNPTAPVTLILHFRSRLTDPIPAEPGNSIVKTYRGYVDYGTSSLSDGGYFVEWKVPLSDFPIEAIEGKYVDAWTGRPPSPPGRIDTTPTEEGVRIVIGQ